MPVSKTLYVSIAASSNTLTTAGTNLTWPSGKVLMDEVLTAQQVAEMLQITPKTLYRWRCEGFGPAGFKAGRRVRYRSDDVSAWIAEKKAEDARLRVEREYAA